MGSDKDYAIAYNDGAGNHVPFEWAKDRKAIVCPQCGRKSPVDSEAIDNFEEAHSGFPRFTKTKHDPGCPVLSKARSEAAKRMHGSGRRP